MGEILDFQVFFLTKQGFGEAGVKTSTPSHC